jgi:hypothetical protein
VESGNATGLGLLAGGDSCDENRFKNVPKMDGDRDSADDGFAVFNG